MSRAPCMNRSGRFALIAASLVALSSLVGSPVRAADAGAPVSSVPACIAVRSESVWVPYGYNHVVTLANGCKRTATCVVSTDVSPEPQSTTIAPEAKAEVTTFMGSPSSTFTAKVSCTLR